MRQQSEPQTRVEGCCLDAVVPEASQAGLLLAAVRLGTSHQALVHIYQPDPFRTPATASGERSSVPAMAWTRDDRLGS